MAQGLSVQGKGTYIKDVVQQMAFPCNEKESRINNVVQDRDFHA